MTTRRLIVAFALLSLCCYAFAQRPLIAPSDAKKINDVVYAKVGSRELHLDMVVPADGTAKLHPCVVWIHGGGWSKGTHKINQAAWLSGKGYVTASVEYRLSGEAIFPAQIYDCKAAIRFLRSHAKDYGIDPDRIGVWGASAGGHLVALLGTTGGVKEEEGAEGDAKESSRVQAVCDFFGPTDLTKWPPMFPAPPQIAGLLGGSPADKPELARLASPVKFVDKTDRPFLIVHGEDDVLVPIAQSIDLYNALKKAGASVTFTRVKNAGHGFIGKNIQPAREEINAQVLAFFDKQLKKQAFSDLVQRDEGNPRLGRQTFIMKPLGVLALLMFAVVCCGACAASRGRPMNATFQNNYLKLAVDASGRVLHFINRKTAKDYCNPGEPFASITKGGRVFPATAAERDGELLKLAFGDSGISAAISISNKGDYFLSEVVSLTGDGVDDVTTICVPLTLKGGVDEPFAGCALALDLRSKIDAWPGPCKRLLATTYKRFGFVGAKVAIIGCPPSRMREILQEAVSAAPDMPHSNLGGPWAMDAECARGSYLFNFDGITVQNAGAWIKLAKSLGMTQIDFHGGGSFRFGDCRPNPATYPNGFKDLKAAIDKLHAAGIRAGLHTYSFMIAKDCPWVTPLPDPRLACDRVLTLSEPIGESDTTVRVDESTQDMSVNTGFFVRNSVTMRIDQELITYTGISKEPPYSLTGCTRGALGTKISSHARGAKAHHLLECFGFFAPDGDSTLFDEVAQKTADAFNQCGFDNIYLDALDAEDVPGGPQNGWHYGSKFVWDVCKKLNTPALMEMSAFHHHLWCVRSRMGAWDHPTRSYKQFIDNHCAANELNKKVFMPSEMGWWAVKTWGGAQVEPTLPDVMEYLLCKCLATDTGYALMQIDPAKYEADPFARRLAEISRRYEELRLSGKVPEKIKAKLRQPGKEFTLEGDKNNWSFRPITYDKRRVEAIDGVSNAWKTKNEFGTQPLRLRIEALLSAGSYDASENTVMADFADPSTFATHHAPPNVKAELTASDLSNKSGTLSGCFTATSTRASREGAWAILEKTFSPPLNLAAQQGMGVWVHGDGQGEILNFQVKSPEHVTEAIGDHYVVIDFTGWRYFELIEPEGERFQRYQWPYNQPKLSWDKETESENAPQHWVAGQYGIYRESVAYDQIGSLSIWYNNLPPGKTVKTYLSPIKALPLLTETLKNPSITVNGRTLTFPVEIESGSYLEFNSITDCKLYDSKGALVSEVKPIGDVPTIKNGENAVKFGTATDGATPRAYVTVITEGEPLN